MPQLRNLHKLLDPAIRAKNLRELRYQLRALWWDATRPAVPEPVFVVGCSRSGAQITYETMYRIPYPYQLLPDAKFVFIQRDGRDSARFMMEGWRMGLGTGCRRRRWRSRPWPRQASLPPPSPPPAHDALGLYSDAVLGP
jgi:hypothetical protein